MSAFFWTVTLAAEMAEQGLELAASRISSLDEDMRPKLCTLYACDYSTPRANGIAIMIDAPYAHHRHGVGRLFLTDSQQASFDMRQNMRPPLVKSCEYLSRDFPRLGTLPTTAMRRLSSGHDSQLLADSSRL